MARQLRQKKENVRAQNGGVATVVGAKWPEARKFGGNPTLVEEDLAWWWRDAGKVAARQREGRLPEQRGQRRDETAVGGSRGFLAGSRGERRRRQRRETVAVAAREQRAM